MVNKEYLVPTISLRVKHN
ncbi:hypothetical protein LINPERHAP1_LOCUS26618 [Linum perenne]